jgi:hypothetical protein
MEKLTLVEFGNIGGKHVAIFRVETLEYNGEYLTSYRAVWEDGKHDFFGWPTNSDVQRILTSQ